MRRLRPPQNAASVSLFPFLAVLICTMGALILLLVVIARQARLQAAAAAARAEVDVDAQHEQVQSLEARIRALTSARDRAAGWIAERREALAQREAVRRQLADKLAGVQSASSKLSDLIDEPMVTDRHAELSRLEARIEALQSELLKARRLAAGQSESYAIVPYEGPNQTRRRPLYIECRGDSIVLQPEGVVLTEDDFEGPLDAGNPLAAALRAAQEHLARNAATNLREPGRSYPLLLVRPDGINAYYAARAALATWAADFGYELVEQDWQLEYQAADEELKNKELLAIEEARRRIREWTELVANSGIRPGRYRAAPGGGGLVRIDGGSDSPPSFRAAPGGGGMVPEESGDRLPARRGSGWSRRPGSAVDRATQPGDSALADSRSAADGEANRGTGNSAAGIGKPATASPTSTSAGSAGRPGSETAVATDQSPPPILPQQMFGQHERQQTGAGSQVESLAGTRGKDWGLPDASRGSFPITRPIRVECRRDRLTLFSDGPGNDRQIPLGPRTEDSVEQFVAAVWEHMDTWGIAGRGMHWRPILHVESDPSAAARMADLKVLLADSGLAIRERPPGRSSRQTDFYER